MPNKGNKMKYKFLYILVGFLFLIIFYSCSTNNKINGTVVCFGDSITYGALVNGHSWVYYISKKHADINFVKEGRSGRKTSDKNEILPVLKKYPNSDYFLIFLGVNDLKNGNDSMVNQCAENMEWMINKIKASSEKTKITILAPSDINLKTMSEINVKKKYNINTKNSLIKLEKKYKKLAEKDSLGFISLLQSVSPQNYVDGLHPNEKGQKEIAEAVWKGLSKLYN